MTGATMAILCEVLGILLVAIILAEVFEAMVLPRRVTRPFRLTRFYYRTGWVIWTWFAHRWTGSHREMILSIFGPLSMLTLFALWTGGLMFGFGLIHHSFADDTTDFATSLYFSGSTFTTLGYGDITPKAPASRAVAVIESATGFGFFAVVVGYLPVLYASFSVRERMIAMLDARAGSPPSGGELLVRLSPGRDGAALQRYLEMAEQWAAELLESHLSYPVLGYYRSQHDTQSWLAALTCTLDASALLLTVVEETDRVQARLTFAMARHALVDLSLILKRRPRPSAERLPPDRLTALCAELRKRGVSVRDDAETLAKLAELRTLYEPFAVELGAFFYLAVPDVWPESDGRPDHWQTSAWMRRAVGFGALAADPKDEHFS